jgi:hypothetical protein
LKQRPLSSSDRVSIAATVYRSCSPETMCTTLNSCTSLLVNLPCYLLDGRRSSDKGVTLCRKVNNGATGGPSHHRQLRSHTREDGAGHPGRDEASSLICGTATTCLLVRQRTTETIKIEGEPSHPLSVHGLNANRVPRT